MSLEPLAGRLRTRDSNTDNSVTISWLIGIAIGQVPTYLTTTRHCYAMVGLDIPSQPAMSSNSLATKENSLALQQSR
jgi:hypothetical protein